MLKDSQHLFKGWMCFLFTSLLVLQNLGYILLYMVDRQLGPLIPLSIITVLSGSLLVFFPCSGVLGEVSIAPSLGETEFPDETKIPP